jgi:death on curing protein
VISVEEVLKIHDILIEKFGGSPGVRDKELLESSVFRPFSTFDSIDLNPTTVAKAAAIIESIVKNHPFMDGNKRTGYTLMRLFLLNEGWTFTPLKMII